MHIVQELSVSSLLLTNHMNFLGYKSTFLAVSSTFSFPALKAQGFSITFSLASPSNIWNTCSLDLRGSTFPGVFSPKRTGTGIFTKQTWFKGCL